MRVPFGFVSVCFVLFAAVGKSQTGQPLAAATPNAQPALKVYSNQALHLRYSYPASFTDASAVVSTAFRASVDENMGSKDAARCITLPFSAMSTAGGQLSIMLLVRADAGCLKRTFTPEQLPEFTQGEVRGLSASGAKPQFGQPVTFTVGGRTAQQLQGTFALPTGDSMRAMVTCVLVKPDVVCWQFLANNEAGLGTMSGFPVTFGEGPPVTLVPPFSGAKKP